MLAVNKTVQKNLINNEMVGTPPLYCISVYLSAETRYFRRPSSANKPGFNEVFLKSN